MIVIGERATDFTMMLQSILDGVHRLRTDERGAVAVTVGVLIIPLVGALAIGFEVSNWYMVTRYMQNAADAATLAAATNGGANYDVEGKAVAARYGFVDGANNVSVAVINTAACPTLVIARQSRVMCRCFCPGFSASRATAT